MDSLIRRDSVTKAFPRKRWSGIVLLAFVSLAGCSAERSAETAAAPDDSVEQHHAESGLPQDANLSMVEEIDPLELSMEGAVADDAAEFSLEPPSLRPEIPAPSAARSRSDMEPRATSADPGDSVVDHRTGTIATASPVGKRSKSGPFASLPAGASHDVEKKFATVPVFYATDRSQGPDSLGEYTISGNRDAFVLLGGCALAFFAVALIQFWRRRQGAGLAFCVFGSASASAATLMLLSGGTNIEKHGVTYGADRGTLVKGICNVTVPETHDLGVVERPSLMRFEFKENQRDHIVLTSAVELSDFDFRRRLSESVDHSADRDLLVFVHGYNVDFQSAVRRTAQIAVDLPFEGVPVCYSWPSQGKLFGYTVDETNAAWTQTHLKQFLLELAKESGADSIHVVAHSMGNRPTTGALSEIAMARHDEKLFDRVVLAAPDVDADQFRRDLAPQLERVANHVTLYASSDDQALIASKQVHGYPRAGESGDHLVVVPGIETVDVTGVDLSLLGHSYYGDSASMLQDLYQVVRHRLPAVNRRLLQPRNRGELTYWQLVQPATRVGAGTAPMR